MGNAEPYLWPAFFKIDGDSFSVEPGSGLIGFPSIASTNGDHGNLGDTDVDEGDDVPIPPSIGLFEGQLKPIPINDPLIRATVGRGRPPGYRRRRRRAHGGGLMAQQPGQDGLHRLRQRGVYGRC